MGINWRQVGMIAVANLALSAVLFAGYKVYQDHVLLASVVVYLNAQASKGAPGSMTGASGGASGEEK